MKKSPLECAVRAGVERELSLREREDGRRGRWGVVHTPAPLARWAMGRVDLVLRERLGLVGGLADARVGLLDVSVGTGVWLGAAMEVAGGRVGAPFAVLGIDRDEGALAAARGVLLPAAERVGWPLALHCGNTLALEDPWPAGVEVRVVVGNPPWATRSDSRAVEPTASWLDDFRRDARGQPLGERRVGVLSDDYVRFLRWSAEQARRAPAAVLCLATNGSFLDGLVHRGVRARLREWFDAIEVLDLGGNALLSRGVGRDENVFGVRPGVALSLAVRGGAKVSPWARVNHSRLRGSAATKWAALGEDGLKFERLPLRDAGAPWQPVASGEALTWPARALPLEAAMPFHREGVQTNRDAFATDRSRPALLARMARYAAGGSGPEARPHFDPERARVALREALARDPEGASWLTPLWYRPFERRWFVTLPAVSHRPRPPLLRAVGPDTPCLLTARKDRGARAWNLFAASLGVADACFLSTRSSCRTRVFPARTPDGEANLDRAAVARWLRPSGVAGDECGAEALVEVALGQLACGDYRRHHDGLLRQGYPRLIPPADREVFFLLRSLGRRLLAAFALQVDPLPRPGTSPSCAVGHIGPPEPWSNVCPRVGAAWREYISVLKAAEGLTVAGGVLARSNHGGS